MGGRGKAPFLEVWEHHALFGRVIRVASALSILYPLTSKAYPIIELAGKG
jgi:hypothetical protein